MVLVPLPGKAARQELVAEGERSLNFAQRLFRLVQAERDNTEAVKRLTAEVAALKEQVRSLQSPEAQLMARLELAAAQAVSDLARRIGFLEGRASRE